MTWIVAQNRDYYPSVEQFEDEARARQAYANLINNSNVYSSYDSCTVFLAHVVESKEIDAE